MSTTVAPTFLHPPTIYARSETWLVPLNDWICHDTKCEQARSRDSETPSPSYSDHHHYPNIARKARVGNPLHPSYLLLCRSCPMIVAPQKAGRRRRPTMWRSRGEEGEDCGGLEGLGATVTNDPAIQPSPWAPTGANSATHRPSTREITQYRFRRLPCCWSFIITRKEVFLLGCWSGIRIQTAFRKLSCLHFLRVAVSFIFRISFF